MPKMSKMPISEDISLIKLRTLTQDHLRNSSIALTVQELDKCLAYLFMLEKWNRVYNLTAIRQAPHMVVPHLLDSLTAKDALFGTRILDFGTGAGLPGIPLSILFPEKLFTLLDCVNKKITFLKQVKHNLKCENVNLMRARVEQYHPNEPFDTIVTRAVAPIARFYQSVQHLCSPKCRLVMMKGGYPEEELQDLPKALALVKITRVDEPFLDKIQRHIIILRVANG